MKTLFAGLLAMGALTGCIVHTHSRGYARGGNGCGGGYHWNGNGCERDRAYRSAPPMDTRDHRRGGQHPAPAGLLSSRR